jgi:hypothetical protein
MKTEQEIKEMLENLEKMQLSRGRKTPIRTGEIKALRFVLGLNDYLGEGVKKEEKKE